MVSHARTRSLTYSSCRRRTSVTCLCPIQVQQRLTKTEACHALSFWVSQAMAGATWGPEFTPKLLSFLVKIYPKGLLYVSELIMKWKRPNLFVFYSKAKAFWSLGGFWERRCVILPGPSEAKRWGGAERPALAATLVGGLVAQQEPKKQSFMKLLKCVYILLYYFFTKWKNSILRNRYIYTLCIFYCISYELKICLCRSASRLLTRGHSPDIIGEIVLTCVALVIWIFFMMPEPL